MDSSSPERSSSDVVDTSANLKWVSLGNKITTVKLDEENFLLWKWQVTTALRGHGLLKFLRNFWLQKAMKVPREDCELIQHMKLSNCVAVWINVKFFAI